MSNQSMPLSYCWVNLAVNSVSEQWAGVVVLLVGVTELLVVFTK